MRMEKMAKNLGRLLLMLLLLPLFTQAKQFKTPEKALAEIYPNAQIEVKNIVLSKEQQEEVQKLSGVKLDTRLVSWYLVKRGKEVIAYAYVDTHVVRTKPEVVLYTITPEGRLDVVEVLAFQEPLEYMPDEEWLKVFKGKELAPGTIRHRRDIPNITGATITARAITDNARKVLAIWQVLFGGKR
jgi:Na+-translocating ferredoxin:NAD+ oxidoreductase RnfG subunit